MTAETKKWYQDDNKRKAFWQSANNLAKSKGVPTSEAHRWVHQELGISTIKDWTDTADAALKILSDAPEWKPEDVADPVPPSSTAPASDAVDIDEALGRKPASPQPKFSADAWAAWVSVTAKKTELTQAQIFELICEQLQLTGKPVIARPSEFDGTLEELAQVFENSYIRTSKRMPGDVSQKPPQEQKLARAAEPTPAASPSPEPQATANIAAPRDRTTTVPNRDRLLAIEPSTMRGFWMDEIAAQLFTQIPREAIKTNPQGKPYIDGRCIPSVLDSVFGKQGFGWRLDVTETRYSTELRKETNWMIIDIIATFLYRVRMPDGAIEWMPCSTVNSCGEHTNSRKYAHAQALTAALKQSFKMLGGFGRLAGGYGQ